MKKSILLCAAICLGFTQINAQNTQESYPNQEVTTTFSQTYSDSLVEAAMNFSFEKTERKGVTYLQVSMRALPGITSDVEAAYDASTNSFVYAFEAEAPDMTTASEQYQGTVVLKEIPLSEESGLEPYIVVTFRKGAKVKTKVKYKNR